MTMIKATMTKEEYIRFNYGHCDAKKCFCLRISWLGTACHHWHPVSDDIIQQMLQFFEKDLPPPE